ncbi:MAG TPA: hypothetical protein VGC24_05295 [Burkholderiaceae bacterium]
MLAGTLAHAAQAQAQAVLTYGDTKIGIRADAALNAPDPTAFDPSGLTGISYIPTGYDVLAPGCPCEAWGVADSISNTGGGTGAFTGTSNITQVSFTSTATTATSVTEMGSVFRVTHAFKPSGVSGVFQADVTITNISAATTHVLYRRAMDWDMTPTAFNEYVTLQTGSASSIVFSSDDGFANGNPLSGPSSILTTGSFTDSGPADHGALFDFDFGTLAPGASTSFTILYGMAADQASAISALTALQAEAYSLGKPDPAQTSVIPPGTPVGGPNTGIFGFKGIGGAPVFAQPRAVPATSPVALALGGVAMLMAAFAMTWRRRFLKG